MSYFPESVLVEILTMVEGLPTWTNISADIVTPIKGTLGFDDSGVLSRLAPGSDLRFDLFNPSGDYDPSSTFYKGQKIRLRIKYGSLVKTKFFGYIDHIDLDVGAWGARQAHVVCIDWLGLAAKTPVRALPGLTNTTIEAAVTALLTQMQAQPERLDFEGGEIILPSVFDQVTKNSTIYSELQNLVMGEWGYIYMRDGGETLKIENALSRNGDGSDYKTTDYYLNDGVAEDFLLEDGTNFLLEDGTNFLLEGEPTPASFDPDMGEKYTSLKSDHGDNLANIINVSAVPVVVGSSTLVLYPFDIATGSRAFLVAAGSTYDLQGQYKDPTAGGAQISGDSVVTPVVTTDWKFNSAADGTGADLSANLTIEFTAGRSGFKAKLANAGPAGYITKFNVRGIPIYRYAPVETTLQDQRSVWDYGDYSIQFTRQYGASSDDVRPFLFRLLMRDRKPRTIFSSPKFNAFDTQDHLAGFLALDIGDQIRLTSTRPASDALYYVQGCKYTIMPGNELITFEYVTAENIAGDPIGITPVAIESSGVQYVDFGYIPSVCGNPRRTVCARFYMPNLPSGLPRLFSWSISPGVNVTLDFAYTFVLGENHLYYQFIVPWTTTPLSAEAVGALGSPTGQWINIAVTYDSTSSANDAQMYENGVALSSAGGTAAVGTLVSDIGSRFLIGDSFVGKVEDVAVYNRFLTPAEITAIYNGGTRLPFASYPQSGLRFFFGGVDSELYAARLDSALGILDTIYDLQNGFAGQPMNKPVLRAVG